MSYFDDNEDYLINKKGMPMPKKKPRLKNPNEVAEEPKKSKSSLFTRGYDDVRRKVEKGSRFTMSCYNCDFFYQAVGDKTEVCQNPDVLKYDMVVTETSIYCNRWVLTKRKQSVKSMFKKR